MTSNLIPLNYRPQSSMGFLYQYLAEKLMSQKTVEIELRMGTFKTDFSKDKFQKKYTAVSKQGHLVVGYNSQNQYKFLDNLVEEFRGYRLKFDPNVDTLKFTRITEELQKLVRESEQRSEILVDFITKNKKRFVWNLSKNLIYENSKSNKENIDVLHQGLEYRLSTSEENCVKIEKISELFKQNFVQFVRVKLRYHFYFQFLDYCLTKTLSLKDQQVIKKLTNLAKEADNKAVQEIELFKIINCTDSKYVNEIEVEICDNEFLKNFIRENNFVAFNSCIDRFFRNFELLHFVDDEFVSKNFEKFCKEKKIPVRYPVIGSYLEKII